MLALAIQSGIDWKLYYFTRPVYLGVSALAERPRDVEAEAGGQRPANAGVRGLKSGGLRLRGQRDQVRSPNQEVLDQRSQDLSWKINR